MTFFYILMYLAVLLAAAGQVMLKIGANADGLDMGIIQLNRWVALGLGAMALSMLFSLRGLSVVPLRDMAFILPTVFIAVPVFSRIFLGEKLTRQAIIGTLIMIAGIILFNVPSIRLF